MTLDTAVLADLAAKAEKAYPGRWFAEHSGSLEPFVAWVHSDSGTVIADVHTFEDAEFIAAFRNEAAALLAEVESLRKALRNLDTAATNYLNATEPKDYAVSALVNARREARAALVSEEGSR